MEMLVLGPVRVISAGKPIPLAPKVRALMALLAVHANRTVSIDRLVDGLWGEDPPPTAAKTLQTYVFLIRRQLTSDGVDAEPGLRIVTEGQGYRLEVAADVLDARRFEDLQERARSELEANPREAARHLSEGLALWHGPPFADFAYEPWAEAEIDRLEELRASALEQQAHARLSLGEHEQIVGDLRHAVSELPFREQLWASLMLALYRSGRRAESLLAFRDAEEALQKELGAEPGRELQDLASRIRDGDPSLSVVRIAAAAPGSSEPMTATPAASNSDSGVSSTAIDRGPEAARRTRRGAVRKRSVFVASAVIAVVVLISTLGARLIGIGESAQPTFTAAEQELERRLPLLVRDECVRDLVEEPPLGLSAAFRCDLAPGAAANYVEYWQFTNSERFNVAIKSLVQQQQLPNGDCSQEQMAVGDWEVGRLHAGQMICYPASGGRWVVWTYLDDHIVGRAFRNDDDWRALYGWAKQLALFLRA